MRFHCLARASGVARSRHHKDSLVFRLQGFSVRPNRFAHSTSVSLSDYWMIRSGTRARTSVENARSFAARRFSGNRSLALLYSVTFSPWISAREGRIGIERVSKRSFVLFPSCFFLYVEFLLISLLIGSLTIVLTIVTPTLLNRN